MAIQDVFKEIEDAPPVQILHGGEVIRVKSSGDQGTRPVTRFLAQQGIPVLKSWYEQGYLVMRLPKTALKAVAEGKGYLKPYVPGRATDEPLETQYLRYGNVDPGSWEAATQEERLAFLAEYAGKDTERAEAKAALEAIRNPPEPDTELTRHEYITSGGTRVLATERFFGAEQIKEGDRILARSKFPEREMTYNIGVGSIITETTPEKHTEIIRIGGETYTREEAPPQYYAFKEAPRKETPIQVEVSITKGMVEAMKAQRQLKLAVSQYEAADEKGRKAAEIRTLLSERGAEIIGAIILKDEAGKARIIQEKMFTDIAAEEAGEGLLGTWKEGKLVDVSYNSLVTTFGVPLIIPEGKIKRSLKEFERSPIYEVAVSAAAGGLLGAASGTATGAKILGSTAGKAVLYGAGAGAITLRGLEVKVAYDVGDYNKAVGLAAVTVMDVAAAYTGYRLGKPAPRGLKFEKVQRVKVKTEIKGAYEKKMKGVELKIEGRESALREQLQIKDLPGLKKAGWKVVTKPVKLKIGKMGIGKKGLSVRELTGGELLLKLKSPKQFWVAREASTGKFYQIGKEVGILSKLGLKPKFGKIDPSRFIDVAGAKMESSWTLISHGKEAVASVSRKFSMEILEPIKNIKIAPEAPKTSPFKPFKGGAGYSAPAKGGAVPGASSAPLEAVSKAINKITPTSVSVKAVPESGAGAAVMAALASVSLPKLEEDIAAKPAVITLTSPEYERRYAPIEFPALISFPKETPDYANVVAPKIGERFKPVTAFALDQAFDTPQKQEPKPVPDFKIEIPGRALKEPIPVPPPVVMPGLPDLEFEKLLGKGRRKEFGIRIIKNPVPEIKDIMRGLKV